MWRQCTSVAVCVVLLILLPAESWACGVTTHNVIAHRALRWFTDNYPGLGAYAQLLREPSNQYAFQNGAAFPDWGYSCPLADLGYPDLPSMSEASHWPPFQAAVVNHILSRYPRPSNGEWNAEAQKLIAFLMGVVSHSVADITWHDIAAAENTQQGFIQALAEADYYVRNSSYSSTQHTEADAGGEFMAAYELNLGFLSDTWVLPADDLSQVFHSLNFSVPPFVIQLCNAELYAEVMAIKYLGKILYPSFAEGAPFMVDSYQGYWLGGVNDMATWTTQCWPKVLDGLNTGQPIEFCFEEKSRLLPHLLPNDALQVARQLRREGLAKALRPYTQRISFDQLIDGGDVLFTNPQVKSDQAIAASEPAIEYKNGAAQCTPETGPDSGSSITFTVPIGYSYTGESLATGEFNGDGLQDFVVGAPGFTPANSNLSQAGAAFIVYGTRATPPGHHTVDLTNSSALAFHGAASNGRFGQAVAALDFNLDGLLDLVVSAPGIGFGDLSYYGRVVVYFGNTKGTFSANPDIIITSSRTWTNLGYTLASDCDLDGDGRPDLVVGSPFARGQAVHTDRWETFTYQKGAVSVFLSSAQRKPNQYLDWRQDADWFEEGEALYDWFGSSMACSPLANGTLLVVSAPGVANPIKQESGYGKIYGFLFPRSPSFLSTGLRGPKLVFSVLGAQKFDQLGLSVSLGNPYAAHSDGLYLAVSMPTRPVSYLPGWEMPQAGVVVLLDVHSDLIARGNTTIDQLKPRTTFQSDQSYSRFGQFVAFGDLNGDGADDLVVAEPHCDTEAGTDAGAVFAWYGGAGFPSGTLPPAPAASASACLRSGRPFALYGRRAAVLDFNGDRTADLLLSGPRDSSAMSTHIGSVTVVLR